MFFWDGLTLLRRVGAALLPQPAPGRARVKRTKFTTMPCSNCGGRTAADAHRARWYCVDDECFAHGVILMLSDGPYFALSARRYHPAPSGTAVAA